MTPDTTRWRSSPEYSYIDDIVAPDLAWEWLRRNDGYQRDYAEFEARPLTPDVAAARVRRRWGLQCFRPAVVDG
ncbi:transcriptional regulator domain-containing protein [Nitratireductor rhodophyticola]|uniref:transcriptional regulator domain-containing protein n=1 Tax=Nitratireductor rhodophyticola TaxID=2854036 RepID=UPI003BABBB8A